MIYKASVLLLLVHGSALTAALVSPNSSSATSASFSDLSASTPSVNLGSTSEHRSTVTLSSLQAGHLPPNSNSRGDYVTTRYLTEDYTYSIPSGFTQTEAYGNGIILIGPTSWSTRPIYPAVEVGNDLNTTSPAPPPWEIGITGVKNNTLRSSLIQYGRGPECTSAYLSYAAANPSQTETAKSAGTITLPNGQTTVAVIYTTIIQIRPLTPGQYCCGVCSLYFNNLQMLYWPAAHPNTACLGKSSDDPDKTSTSASNVPRNQSIYATDSDGYVFTSPSIYVKFPTVSATDACGLIGSAATSITLAFSPGELSTFVWDDGPFTSVLDTADLPCGPWNGTNHFLPEAWSNSSYYQPLIVLPSKLVDVVPSWKSCTADIFEGQDPPRTLSPATTLAPPLTNADLHTQANAASPSPSIPQLPLKTGAGDAHHDDPGSTGNPAPGPTGPSLGNSGDPSNFDSSSKANDLSLGSSAIPNGAYLPSRPYDPSTGDLGDPENHDHSPEPDDPSTGDPADISASLPGSLTPAPTQAQALAGGTPALGQSILPEVEPSETKNTPLNFPPAVGLQGFTIVQGAAAVTISNVPVVYRSGSISAGGQVQTIPTSWGQGAQNASPLIVAGFTFSAIPTAAVFGSDSQVKDSNTPVADSSDPATYINVGGQTIAVDSSAISVAGTILKPGDPGVTIDGTPISLGSSFFVVGSRTETFSPSPTIMPTQSPFIALGGKTLSISSNAIIIDGTTLKPADPAITVHGTPVSLGSSILVVGTHTQSLILSRPQSTPTPTIAPSYLTFGGKTIAVAASSIVVAGHILTPEGPVEIANGTLVSLGSSVLVIGTQTMDFALPTSSATANSGEGIGALILKGLGGIGGSTVAAPRQTAGLNGTVMFVGGARKGSSWFKGCVAWIWAVFVLLV